MRLFHERAIPRTAPLTKSDEEECFTDSGRVTGVYLTAEAPSGAKDIVVSVDTDESAVAEFEITRPGDAGRSFVVPFTVIKAWRDAS